MGRTRTFVEVVSKGGNMEIPGVKGGETEDKEAKEVIWDGANDDGTWLSKCAVGVLKRFDKVFRVN